MSKEIFISSTPHETRLAIVEDDALAEIYYERENEYTLAGSIYNGRVTRVLPGMQSSFVDIGLERDAFLYITDFMEEAGDTADFEGAGNGSASARPAARGESGRSGSGSRGSREARPAGNETRAEARPQRSAEPTDAELFNEAVSGLEPARRSGEGERSERSGSRRGGRNRRSRTEGREPRPEAGGAGVREPESTDAVSGEPLAGNVSVPDILEEVGEGAPGADGSRRWRGRRGRRGGRGPGRAEGLGSDSADSGTERAETSPAAAVSEAVPESLSGAKRGPAETGPIADAYGFGQPLELAAGAEPRNADLARDGRRENRPAGDSDRGDGRRGERASERGEGRGRGSRDGGTPPPVRAPRGFAPKPDRYPIAGEDARTSPPDRAPRYGVEPELEQPTGPPIILPGESLGKYRAGGEELRSQAAASTLTPLPAAPEFVLPGGWDGGAVLPGETLRSRAGSAPGQSRDGRNRAPGAAREREPEPAPRSFRPEAARLEPEPAAAPAPAGFSSLAVSSPASSSYVTAAAVESTSTEPLATHEAGSTPESDPVHTTSVPPPPLPIEPPAAAEEWEPRVASASFRVDPAPPSEFRQSAPTLAPEEPSEATEAREDPPAETYGVASAGATPEPREAVFEGHEALADSHQEPESAPGEITHLSETGELYDEPQDASLLPAAAEVEVDPRTSHVQALRPESPDELENEQRFAPGSGLLEEEELTDEEDDLAALPHTPRNTTLQTLHAGTGDAAEQETLEGGADLGAMLREMSIDQITRGGQAAAALDDEEDDFDEDFFEEDQSEEDGDETAESEDLDRLSHDSEYSGQPGYEPIGDEAVDELDRAAFGDLSEAPAPRSPERREGTGERERRGGGQGRSDREGRRGDRGAQGEGRGAQGEARGAGNGSGERNRSREADRGGRRDGRVGRHTAQLTNLPAISDLLKPGQELLCQIAKEPIAKKGARITSHIALPGRFLVFMPTVSHTGVSRKIESDAERRRLREILLSERGDAAGGFIVRTAASGASEEELRADLRFLLNLWADIKQRSESSKAPALIYHDLNLIERVLRDQVTDSFSAIWVDTEAEYERVLRFLQRFQPSLLRRVKLYTKEVPMYEQFGISEEINKALRSKVWLKSGGSIVINQTEALVAIDINTGKFVGKTARLEDTIVKTNLDAIPEIVRQIRLRDLGGIIIIDFIDMEDRRNRHRVMAALEDELKLDRAPSKVLQFNDFGLVAITRKRVKQSLERTLSTTCGVCQGTGMTKSPVTVANDIYIEMRKMQKHLDRGDVMLRVNPEVVKQLKAPGTRWLQEMEEMVGKTILVKSDPSLHPEQFDIH